MRGEKLMTHKKDRDHVMAEITLAHLLRPAQEQGCCVSPEQARVFLNEEGREYEMWKHMMQAVKNLLPPAYCTLHYDNDTRSN